LRGDAEFDGRLESAVEIVKGITDGATVLRGSAGTVRDGTAVKLGTAPGPALAPSFAPSVAASSAVATAR
jgi:hypothetical protein